MPNPELYCQSLNTSAAAEDANYIIAGHRPHQKQRNPHPREQHLPPARYPWQGVGRFWFDDFCWFSALVVVAIARCKVGDRRPIVAAMSCHTGETCRQPCGHRLWPQRFGFGLRPTCVGDKGEVYTIGIPLDTWHANCGNFQSKGSTAAETPAKSCEITPNTNPKQLPVCWRFLVAVCRL